MNNVLECSLRMSTGSASLTQACRRRLPTRRFQWFGALSRVSDLVNVQGSGIGAPEAQCCGKKILTELVTPHPDDEVPVMDDKELLDGLFYRLKAIKEAEGILHISELTPDGKHPLTFYSEVTSNHAEIRKVPLFLWKDLFFISNDLVHFTTLLFLLRTFINDATKEAGTYHQNWYDARYLSYASVLHSAVYNFWDRIGDLLHCFFTTGLSDDRVYMGRVLNNFPAAHRVSANFQQINEIYIDHVRPLVFERNEDVHNQSLATTHFYGAILARGDRQREQTELKLRLPDLFKEQIDFAYKGFELALRLIEERGQKS